MSISVDGIVSFFFCAYTCYLSYQSRLVLNWYCFSIVVSFVLENEKFVSASRKTQK